MKTNEPRIHSFLCVMPWHRLLVGILVVCLGVSAGSLQAAAPMPFHSTGRCEEPPDLDGRLNDSCWRHCLELGGFTAPGTHAIAEAQTRVFFVWDERHLYIGIRADQLDMDNLKPASRTHDDPDMWRNDCVELFFDRNGDRQTFYQLMVNRLGTLYDARCDPGAGAEERSDVSWESAAASAAHADQAGWSVELAIPWSSLGGRVEIGDTWRMNVVRDNASDQEASSWVPLDEYRWRVPEQFAPLRFVRRTPAFRLGFPTSVVDSERFSFACSARHAGSYDLTLDIAPFVSHHRRLDLAAGEAVEGTLEYASDSWPHAPHAGLRIGLVQDGETLFRWVRHHLLPFIEVEVVALPNGDTRPRAIAADWPTVFQLDTRHTFPGAQPPAQSVNRSWRIVVEAARGIEAGNELPTTSVERNGITFDVYEIPRRKVHCGSNWHSFGVNTSLPAGQEHTLYYYAAWEGGRQEPRPLPVRTVAVGRTEAPRRFVTGFYNFYLQRLNQMDTVRRLRACGVNCLSVLRVREPEVYEQIRSLGMFMREGDYFWPGRMQGWSDWPKNDRAARNLDRNGYPTVGKAGYQLCPSYRGAELRKAMGKTLERIAQSGVNWFAFDMEGYVMPAGDQGCFCDRCLQAFEDFRRDRFAELPEMDPREFEGSPDAHPLHHAAWVAFKDHQWAGLFRAMKQQAADVVGQTCPKSGPVMSEWSFGRPWDLESVHRTYRGWEFVRTFDWFEVSAYSGVQRFVDRQLEREAMLAEHAPADIEVDWIVTPSPRRLSKEGGTGYYATDVMEHPDEFKYKLFEAAAFGAKGVYPWRYSDVDADSMRQWVEGIGAIAQVENVIVDGTRIEDVHGSNPQVGVRGMEVGREAVLVVAEYRSAGPVDTVVTYPVENASEVRDLETGETIADITPEQNGFRVELSPQRRARLLHIVAPGHAYEPAVTIIQRGPPEDVSVSMLSPAATAERAVEYPVQFRHEAFAEMLNEGIPARGVISAHGARVGDEWHENVWTYWFASTGDSPESWALKPMRWDMHTRWAKAWHGLFSADLQEDGYRSPVVTRDRIYIKREDPFARVAAVALRNPFTQAVSARLEGNIRVHKTRTGCDVFVYLQSPAGDITLITSTLDPEAVGWNGHAGAERPDREYLRLNAAVKLEPGALLAFAGYITAESLAAVEGRNIFEMFADNDRWGPLYRPNVTLVIEP